jgi:hypothetical protein
LVFIHCFPLSSIAAMHLSGDCTCLSGP